MSRIDVTISCRVFDPQALWDKAHARAVIEGHDGESVGVCLGTRDAPDMGGCLQMIFDRFDLLDGAEIEGSESQITEDDDAAEAA